MDCLWATGGLVLLFGMIAGACLLAIVIKAQQHEPGIE